MNKMLLIAESKISSISKEKEAFVQRQNEAVASIQARRGMLVTAEQDLRESRIEAVLNEEARQAISKKQKAVTILQAEIEELDIEIEAVRRKIAELEMRAGQAELELRRNKIDLLLERCAVLREQYTTAADKYAEAFKQLSVCVDALQGLNGRADLKERFPELLQFPLPTIRCESSQQANIIQLSLAPNREFRRLVPFVVAKDEQAKILDGLLS